jgi:protocatechuate 3,4-dioxygenase alpha subunit
MRGLLHHLYTRIYFDDEQVANERDALLAAVPTERRDTLMGRRIIGEDRLAYRFDIHLQGPRETVFFDI